MTAPSLDQSVREAYARDASGLWRVADAIARPQTVDELRDTVRRALSSRTSITVAGAQTSTTGASITDHGLLVSTRALARIIDIDVTARRARVEPGVIIGDLNRELAAHDLRFAPDPTSEYECTIGGSIACNASGARTLRYGATRAHVSALTVLTGTGDELTLRRRSHEKNAVGYAPVHDPVDWFVGSEGTLGVILDAELTLVPRPVREAGLAIPFPTARDAFAFTIAARESELRPRCLEYFDDASLAIVRAWSAPLATWAVDAKAMMYAECDSDGDELPLDAWLELAERHKANDADVRVFDGESAIRDARALRHAVPAAIHERTAPYLKLGGRRVSTDWAVPYRRAGDAIERANQIARQAGVPFPYTYGHLGNGHPHQNFVARDPEEVERCEQVVETMLREVVAMDGTIAAEHGVGKVKARWAPLQLSSVQLGMMRAIKRELDPHGLLAPGNLWA